MALDIEADTKPSTENGMIRIAMTKAHHFRVVMAGFVSWPDDAARLSAVTGFRSALSLARATSRPADIVSSHPAPAATFARRMLFRVASSTVRPVSAA